jgi:predicted nucleotidyltransferase
LPGEALLKISAWRDRRLLVDARDARDLLTLVRSYETVGNQVRIYEQDREVCESLGWDPELKRKPARESVLTRTVAVAGVSFLGAVLPITV